MQQTIDGWINSAVAWYALIPAEAWAIVVGLFIGLAVTQWVKRNFPIKAFFPGLSHIKQKLYIRLLSLVCTAVPTYFIWPKNGEADNPVWAAIAVGFGAPIIYKVVSFFLYKKWPDLKVRFTGTT